MDEIQACILRVKLKYINKIITKKRLFAQHYLDNIKGDVVLPRIKDDEYDVFHIFNVRVKDRDKTRTALENFGIMTDIHYPIPPHKQEAMSNYVKGSFPIAEEMSKSQLSLPISFGASMEEIEYVCSKLNEIV